MADATDLTSHAGRKTTKVILAQENETLRRRAANWEAVGALATRLSRGESLDVVLNETVRDCAQQLRADIFCIFLLTADQQHLEVRASVGLDTDLVQPIPIPAGESLTSLNEKDLRDLLVRFSARGRDTEKEGHTLCLPLIYRGVPLGVLSLTRERRGGFNAGERDVLLAIANQIAVAAFLEGPAHMMMIQERAERELHFAHMLKNEVIPGDPPEMPGYRVGVRTLRSIDSGGDFYDFFPLPEGRWAMLLGETTGRGVKGALNVTYLQLNIRAGFALGLSVDAVLKELNRTMIEDGRRGQMVSACLLEIDPASGSVRLARVGSAAAFHLPERGASEAVELGAGGATPLGVLSQITVPVESVSLGQTGAILLSTDGVNKCEQLERHCCSREALRRCFAEQLGVEAPDADQPIGHRLAGCLWRNLAGAMLEDEITLLSIEAGSSGA